MREKVDYMQYYTSWRTSGNGMCTAVCGMGK